MNESTNIFTAGLEEQERREAGEFDGLLGQFGDESSQVLRDILSFLRNFILDRFSEFHARALLEEHEIKPGYRNVTPVDSDVMVVVDLLNSIKSAARCEPEKFAELVFGKAGVRDAKRQAGTRKVRRPDINEWIDKELKRLPDATSSDLFDRAPDEFKEYIQTLDAFRKRVTLRRKVIRAASN